jgi:hypothetical protein
MRPARIGLALLLAAWAVVSLDRGRAATQSPPAFALVGGTLIDGTGAGPVRDSVILVRGDRIERVGTSAARSSTKRTPAEKGSRPMARPMRRFASVSRLAWTTFSTSASTVRSTRPTSWPVFARE